MKIEQNIKKTLKVSLIFLAIGLMLGALIVFAATPSSTFYISSGIYPGAPSYTVWKEGGDYFAKDARGLIAYSGTNASEIMEDSIAAQSEGSILIANDIAISTTISVSKSVTLFSNGKSVLTVSGAIYAFTTTSGCSELVIQNIEVQAASGYGINTADNCLIKLDNVLINCTFYAVRLYGSAGGKTIDLHVQNCELYSHDATVKDTIYLRQISSSYIIIENSKIEGGIMTWDTTKLNYVFITNNVFYDSLQPGIYLYCDSTEYIEISNNVLTDCYSNGINYKGSIYVAMENYTRTLIIESNEVYFTSGFTTSEDSNGIVVETFDDFYNIIVSGNIVQSNATTTKNGIYLHGLVGATTRTFVVSDNTVSGMEKAILITYCRYGVVSGNAIGDIRMHGLWLSGSRYISCTGNNVEGVSTGAANTYNALYLENCTHSTITGNIYLGGKHGIEEDAYCDYNIITSCWTDGDTSGIKTTGANTKTNLCYNGTSWIA